MPLPAAPRRLSRLARRPSTVFLPDGVGDGAAGAVIGEQVLAGAMATASKARLMQAAVATASGPSGSWSWVGFSGGHGPLRMATLDPPPRSWPRSWGRACGGRDGDDDQGDEEHRLVPGDT